MADNIIPIKPKREAAAGRLDEDEKGVGLKRHPWRKAKPDRHQRIVFHD